MTKTPSNRRRLPRITDELIATYIRHEELRPIYYGCGGAELCRSNDPAHQCPECREFVTLTNRLDKGIGWQPWEIGAVDADSAEPPARLNALCARSWRRSWKFRCMLEAAAAKAEGLKSCAQFGQRCR